MTASAAIRRYPRVVFTVALCFYIFFMGREPVRRGAYRDVPTAHGTT